MVWADVSNSTRLDAFLDEFNLVLPVHKLKPQFQSKVSIPIFRIISSRTKLPIAISLNKIQLLLQFLVIP